MFVAAALILGTLVTALWIWVRSHATPEELLAGSRLALERGDYEEAERLAARVPADAPEFAEACLVAGESATKLQRLKQALEHYGRLPADGSKAALLGWSCAGDILVQLGRPAEAERHYRRVLERRPDDVATRAQLAALLTAHARRWESIPHLLSLIQGGRFSIDHLLWLGNTRSTVTLPEKVEPETSSVADPNVLIALARSAVGDSDHEEVERFARRALDLDSGQIEAWSLLGSALVHGPADAFLEWHHALPPEARQHPDIWFAQGVWARNHDQDDVAVRCFWEAVRQDPHHRAANYQLGQALTAVGRTSEAAGFLERADRLQELEGVLDAIYRGRLQIAQAIAAVRRAASLMESLGRFWEAAGWAQVALAADRRQSWAIEILDRVRGRLGRASPRVAPESDLARQIDLSAFPLPQWPSGGSVLHPLAGVAPAAGSVQFTDDARQAGIDFQYFNGYTPAVRGARMFAATGGGVAGRDFDGDGWPDLYFTQGCRWPPRENDHEYGDRLYRNLGNGRFEDTTLAAGLGDNRYGQGLAVGDLDNDGFPDLYVANVGCNRLYHNNGDGTFREITAECGIHESRWTSSCLLADLNGDALPDLYDVNYLEGPLAYELVCRSAQGTEQMCDPDYFEAAQDQLFLNLGDGRFQDVSQTAGIVVPDGKGLGIVAADFDGSGRLSLFVANDGVANFYFVNETSPPGTMPRFREQGLASGLAFDRDGDAQACMGVAADDADGDGRLDLFVTNYYRESNTLYLQAREDLFVDGTREAGLREPSFWLLGFGTQFLDAELDGEPDLVITNGHVSDYTAEGQPYEMRPQFLRNSGGGRFVELPPDTLGAFFEGRHVGRGLARLDWNRDGLEDFVVSHLGARAALVTNRSAPAGHMLALELRGVTNSRDAIGTTVRLEAGGRVRTRQLTGGDGYYAVNESRMIFGLGPAERVDALTVRWPSGHEQTFEDVPAGQAYILVEGQRLLPIAEYALP
jgi:tetratricopeptide (TPR) repeat protein